MASILKTDKGYRAQIYVKGVRESKVFRTRREAMSWSSSREYELKTHAGKPVGEAKSLADAITRYEIELLPLKRGHRTESHRLKTFLNDPVLNAARPIGAFTPDDLGIWRDARLKKTSAGTVIRDCSLLGGIFQTAKQEWRWINENPMRDVRKPKAPPHRTTVITPQQIRLMLRAMQYGKQIRTITQSVAVCFLVALRTGMRAGELASLTWANVRDDYVILPITKTTPRDVPLTRKAHRLIEKMRGFDPKSVFSIKVETLDALFRRARARAGLSDFTFHDSRHTAATWLAPRMDILDLCKMFGWTNPKQAMTYYNPRASDIAKRIKI
jgi:integrase